MNIKKTLLINLLILNYINLCISYDLTLVTYVQFDDGLHRIPINLLNALHEDLTANYITTHPEQPLNTREIPIEISKILTNNDKSPGNVALLTDNLWYKFSEPSKFMPRGAKIKLAYSMLESTQIPKKWTQILNAKFDAVVVPDESLVNVYMSSGVRIPIFVLPLILNLEEFLEHPEKMGKNTPFVFGMSAAYWGRKNHLPLIKAFIEEFGNNPEVKLKLTGRTANSPDQPVFDQITELLKNQKVNNIEIQCKSLTGNEYLDFMASLDCYVLVSQGEGFSISPREALSLGVPCILSNNSAHKTICQSGYVRSVETPLAIPAYYDYFGSQCGNFYTCTVEEVRKAIRDVYINYETYLKKAKMGKIWATQYLGKSLKKRYINLIKPKKIILGEKNMITDDYLMTNSRRLHRKYVEVFKLNP